MVGSPWSQGGQFFYENIIVSWPEFEMTGPKGISLNQSSLGSLKEFANMYDTA